MNFQTIKAAIQPTLQTQALGAFQVMGSAGEGRDADALALLPLVEVFFDGSEFVKGASSSVGRKSHDVTFKINLTTVTPGAADLTGLDNPSTTPAMAAQIIANAKTSEGAADTAFDNLVSQVWNILANPANTFMGLPVGSFSNLWIDAIKKGGPIGRGEYTVLSGTMNLTLRASEFPPSEIPVPGNAVDTLLKPTLDPTANPLTVGLNPGVTLDPKITSSDLGLKVGS